MALCDRDGGQYTTGKSGKLGFSIVKPDIGYSTSSSTAMEMCDTQVGMGKFAFCEERTSWKPALRERRHKCMECRIEQWDVANKEDCCSGEKTSGHECDPRWCPGNAECDKTQAGKDECTANPDDIVKDVCIERCSALGHPLWCDKAGKAYCDKNPTSKICEINAPDVYNWVNFDGKCYCENYDEILIWLGFSKAPIRGGQMTERRDLYFLAQPKLLKAQFKKAIK